MTTVGHEVFVVSLRSLSEGGTEECGPYCVYWRRWNTTVYSHSVSSEEEGVKGRGGSEGIKSEDSS